MRTPHILFCLFVAAILTIIFVSIPASATTYQDNFVPTMTEDNDGLGNITSASTVSGTYAAWKSFDHDYTIYHGWLNNAGAALPNYLTIQTGASHTVRKYTIYGVWESGYNDQCPGGWQFEGSNDGSTWSVLDTQTGITWSKFQLDNKSYEISNTNAYTYYQLNITSRTGANYNGILEVLLFEAQPTAPVSSFTSQNISIATNSTSRGWEGVAPFYLQFTDTSTNTPTSWAYGQSNLTATAWTVANTSQNSVVRLVAGNWSLNLTATNSAGSNVSAQTLLVNVSSSAPAVLAPIVNWSVSPVTLIFPGRVTFNDTSLYDGGVHDPTAWNYTPGDGNVNVSLGLRNVSYQYYKRGLWNATLNVSNSAGYNVTYQWIRVIGYQG